MSPTEPNYSVSIYYSTSHRKLHLKTFLSEDLVRSVEGNLDSLQA